MRWPFPKWLASSSYVDAEIRAQDAHFRVMRKVEALLKERDEARAEVARLKELAGDCEAAHEHTLVLWGDDREKAARLEAEVARLEAEVERLRAEAPDGA